MPSPFPGMDPYLEPHWLDVHARLVTYAADALNERLPGNLVASVEERAAITTERSGERTVGPDVRVFEPPVPDYTVVEAPARAGSAVAAPFRLAAPDDEPVTERFIRVIEPGTERLVTVIEVVSPTNKRGEGLGAFRLKRIELLAAGVNFVEIDLTRAGDWRGLLRPKLCPDAAVAPYRAAVRVADEPGAVYLFPIHLRDRLPAVPIPLRPDDPKVELELQPLLDRVYDAGRYDRRRIYDRPLDPPVEPAEQAWVDERLRSTGT